MLILKGIMTVNIEVDYETMFGNGNTGAIHLFTGVSTVEEMVKVHMDKIGAEIEAVLNNKPLLRYNLDGKLIQNVEQPVEEEVAEEPVSEPDEEQSAPEYPVHYDDVDLSNNIVDGEFTEINPEPKDLIGYLDNSLNQISMELGLPQKIKVNGELFAQLTNLHAPAEFVISNYRGFPVEQEGMEEAYVIVYKTYTGSEIKTFQSEIL